MTTYYRHAFEHIVNGNAVSHIHMEQKHKFLIEHGS